MARFFIDRPIFAWVIAIVIMLAGLLAIDTLPIAQYPEIAPPSVRVTTSYRGAAASTVESNVVQVSCYESRSKINPLIPPPASPLKTARPAAMPARHIR